MPKQSGRIYEAMRRIKTQSLDVRLWINLEDFSSSKDQAAEFEAIESLAMTIRNDLVNPWEHSISSTIQSSGMSRDSIEYSLLIHDLAQTIADVFPKVNAVEILDLETRQGSLAYNDWP